MDQSRCSPGAVTEVHESEFKVEMERLEGLINQLELSSKALRDAIAPVLSNVPGAKDEASGPGPAESELTAWLRAQNYRLIEANMILRDTEGRVRL